MIGSWAESFQHEVDRRTPEQHLGVLGEGVRGLLGQLETASAVGAGVFIAGNGGSAAMASHFASELVGVSNRQVRALSLLADVSIVSALANDISWAAALSEYLRIAGRSGDLVVAMSTSGRSTNILDLLGTARGLGMSTCLLTGVLEPSAKRLAEIQIEVPTSDVDLIQETHLAIVHLVCRQLQEM